MLYFHVSFIIFYLFKSIDTTHTKINKKSIYLNEFKIVLYSYKEINFAICSIVQHKIFHKRKYVCIMCSMTAIFIIFNNSAIKDWLNVTISFYQISFRASMFPRFYKIETFIKPPLKLKLNRRPFEWFCTIMVFSCGFSNWISFVLFALYCPTFFY